MKKLVSLLFFAWFVHSCTNEKKPVLSAFSDSFSDSWSFKLFEDETFYIFLPDSSREGVYEIIGDTVFLKYHKKVNDQIWPSKMLIDRANKKVKTIDLPKEIEIELQNCCIQK